MLTLQYILFLSSVLLFFPAAGIDAYADVVHAVHRNLLNHRPRTSLAAPNREQTFFVVVLLVFIILVSVYRPTSTTRYAATSLAVVPLAAEAGFGECNDGNAVGRLLEVFAGFLANLGELVPTMARLVEVWVALSRCFRRLNAVELRLWVMETSLTTIKVKLDGCVGRAGNLVLVLNQQVGCLGTMVSRLSESSQELTLGLRELQKDVDALKGETQATNAGNDELEKADAVHLDEMDVLKSVVGAKDKEIKQMEEKLEQQDKLLLECQTKDNKEIKKMAEKLEQKYKLLLECRTELLALNAETAEAENADEEGGGGKGDGSGGKGQ